MTPDAAVALELLGHLQAANYRFTAVTPVTHQRVVTNRPGSSVSDLRSVFGWNLPFADGVLPPTLFGRLKAAGIVEPTGSEWQSKWRVASLDDDLFLHSGFPTAQADAIFFGPDTYRFARFVKQALGPRLARLGSREHVAPLRVLDIGCGSGAGGIAVARAIASAEIDAALTMADINPLALAVTRINAQLASVLINCAEGDALSAVQGDFDVIVCNPPYLQDDAQRAYRHGGSDLGRALGVRITADSLGRLAPGGQLLLYTGVAMVDGVDPFLAEVAPLLSAAGLDWHYDEIDPDVFGEEIERPVYAHIDRIAAVGLVATRASALHGVQP